MQNKNSRKTDFAKNLKPIKSDSASCGAAIYFLTKKISYDIIINCSHIRFYGMLIVHNHDFRGA